MSKAVFITILGFVVLGAYYAYGSQENIVLTTDRLADHQHEVLARNAALAGFNMAKQELPASFASTQFEGTYEGRDYAVTVDVDGNVAEITSTGRSTREDGEEVFFNIFTRVQRVPLPDIAPEAPQFLQYALMSEGNLRIGGNVEGDVYAESSSASQLNANFHTNGNLHVDGNASEIKGFGTYVGTATANPAKALTKTFKPNYNPTSDPSVQRVPPIEIQQLDAAEFLATLAPDQTTAGDHTLSGNLDLGGTRDDPYVWHVQGDLTASGGATLSGYVVFVVEGDIDFSGNLIAGDGGWDGGDESNVAFYATGNIAIEGNIDIYGQILANGGLRFRGTPNMYGSLTTAGSVDLGGTPNFFYRTPSPALTTPWQDPVFQYNLVAYTEW